MNSSRAAIGLAVLMLTTGAPAQEPATEPYRPLFTQEMIENASQEQAARMSATEARNRAAWEERQQALREREQEAQPPARETASAPPPRSRTRGKVYKWVDKDGRVHFGDAPAGAGAKEVEVKGIARVQGKPPPPPGSTGGGGGERD